MIKKGEAAATNFHLQLAVGVFDQIRTESDNTLTNSTSQGKFVGTLRTVSLKLGHVSSAARTGFNFNWTGSGKLLRFGYKIKIDDQSADNVFVFRAEGNERRFASYQINARVLSDQ